MDFPNDEITRELFDAACSLAEEISVYNAHPGVVNGHNPLVVITAIFMFAVAEAKKMGLPEDRIQDLVRLCYFGVESNVVREH